MRLSTRSTYGMRALVELALTSGRGPVSATLIAERQGLSAAYLEQLLHRLRRQGLVTSVRGPRGGYRLAKAPAKVTMAEVAQTLDGGQGADVGRRRGLGAAQRAAWVAEAVQHCVHERLTQALHDVTLQDVCDEVQALGGDPLDHRHVFHI